MLTKPVSGAAMGMLGTRGGARLSSNRPPIIRSDCSRIVSGVNSGISDVM